MHLSWTQHSKSKPGSGVFSSSVLEACHVSKPNDKWKELTWRKWKKTRSTFQKSHCSVKQGPRRKAWHKDSKHQIKCLIPATPTLWAATMASRKFSSEPSWTDLRIQACTECRVRRSYEHRMVLYGFILNATKRSTSNDCTCRSLVDALETRILQCFFKTSHQGRCFQVQSPWRAPQGVSTLGWKVQQKSGRVFTL